MLKMIRLIPCLLAFMTQNIIAQAAFAGNDDAINTDGPFSSEGHVTEPVRSVEAGAGGNLKLERKYRTNVESQYEWHVHTLWESRYITEGRDNLSGNSLLSASTEFSIEEFSVVPWIAASSAADYTEFNLNIVYGTKLTQQLILYGGYSYIRIDESSDIVNDNLLSLDLAYKWLKNIDFLASVYHSLYDDGSFMEVAVKYNNELRKMIHFSVQGLIGANAGFIADGHNGANNVQLRANISYYPMAQLEIYSYAGYNRAINRNEVQFAGDALLKDFFWGGVGFSYMF